MLLEAAWLSGIRGVAVPRFGALKWDNWGTNSNEPQPRIWRSAAGALATISTEPKGA